MLNRKACDMPLRAHFVTLTSFEHHGHTLTPRGVRAHVFYAVHDDAMRRQGLDLFLAFSLRPNLRYPQRSDEHRKRGDQTF